jgi:hypothetical protein
VRKLVCSGCQAVYQDETWASLALAQRIEPPEVRRLVLDWPPEVCIEVRACSRCSWLIAAKRPWRATAEHGTRVSRTKRRRFDRCGIAAQVRTRLDCVVTMDRRGLHGGFQGEGGGAQ